jgi:hypothetical protein
VRWQEYQDHRPAEREVAAWFRRWPDANIAIITGEISNLVVLDIDPGHGGDESLRDLVTQFGPLPETLTVRTGGGGRHLYFAAPADGRPMPSRVGLRPGIDIRAEGGLVIAPPSVHPSGRRYVWEAADAAPAPMPHWLPRLLRAPASRRGHAVQYWRDLVVRGVAEGERNSTIASFAGHLFRHEVDSEVVKELLLCWNRVRAKPPLDDAEVTATVDSIRRTHEHHAGEKPPPEDEK